MTENITAVVACGGCGTRLWPLSRKSFPKQFVPLIHGASLLKLTLDRVGLLAPTTIAVAAEEHRFIVADSMRDARARGVVMLEPVARNTTAAAAMAALLVRPEELLLFSPADHHIPDAQAFVQTVLLGVPSAAAGEVVTFGVSPTFPSTAYGYIVPGGPRPDGSHQVAQFIEKPAADRARELISQGGVLWNSGIFLARARTLLAALAQHAPDILHDCEEAVRRARSEHAGGEDPETTFVWADRLALDRCRSQSIDHAVLEKHSHVCVVPFKGSWSDVGSWTALSELTEPDAANNRVGGFGRVHASCNTFVHAPHRPVVALGTKDLLIVDTPDAVLVAHRDAADKVKEVVDELLQEEAPQAVENRKVIRPWGWYDTVDFGERFQVKRIGVKPGASLSLQRHHHRAEHWVVVSGTARVTRGTETFLVGENESAYIPIGEIHRLHNPGKVDLEVIEVQSGSYLGEDDIVRLDDRYGRLPS